MQQILMNVPLKLDFKGCYQFVFNFYMLHCFISFTIFATLFPNSDCCWGMLMQGFSIFSIEYYGNAQVCWQQYGIQ